MAPITLTCTLTGTLDDGSPSEDVIACMPMSGIRRSIGLYGDDLVVTVKAADWAALDWDVTKPISIVFGDSASPITLGGYYFNRVSAGMFGIMPETETIALGTIVVFLETQPRRLREARGGLLTIGTVNRLGEDGLVDTAHADYMTWQELVDAALDATGLAHDACPSSINTSIDGSTPLDAPGPLDWGNARAISELEALLAQVGYAAVFANDGSKISVVRLFRSGENLSLPSLITDNDDKYYEDVSASLRGSTIVVTSGTTRATIITSRSLDDTDEPALEWVGFDERTGDWLNATEWDSLYPTEIQPGTIADFQSGPDGLDPEEMRGFARLFTALRLVDDTTDENPANHTLDRTQRSRFVIPSTLAGDSVELARITGVVLGRFCVHAAASQFVNHPTSDAGDPIRLDGVQLIPGEGVFVLPSDVTWVRMDSVSIGTYAEARALADDDLTIWFAHEADTGVYLQDYFVAAYLVGVTAGVVSLTELTGEDLDDAIADPMSVKIDAPFLRLISYQNPGDATPTPINETELKAVAEQLALMKAGASLVTTAVIPLRGFINVQPGAASGAVSSVEWRLTEGRTIVQVNSHEVPQASYDRAERQARRSIAAGLRRYSLPGSSAGQADTRAGSTPGELAGVGGGSGGGRGTAPEAASGSRGRERALRGGEGISSQGVRPGDGYPRQAEVSEVLARVTDATVLASRRWVYELTEVRLSGSTFIDSDRVFSGINLAEAGNGATGIQGNGTDADLYTGTFELQPIRGGRVVRAYGLIGSYYVFSATNAVDGECEVAE